MTIFNRKLLLGIFCFFAVNSEASNKISFAEIVELSSGNLKIVFHLDQVALINSYALDDPSRIVIDVKTLHWIVL